MEAIKKKMTSLAAETANAEARAKKYEDESKVANDIADKTEDQVRNLQKKLQALEGKYDSTTENLFNAEAKLEEKEKILANAEADVGNLARRILLVEDEVIILFYSNWCKKTWLFPVVTLGPKEWGKVGQVCPEPLCGI